MSVRLYTEFKKFHNNICLDGESSVLKEKREILQKDFEEKFPKLSAAIGLLVSKTNLRFWDQGSYRKNVSTVIRGSSVDRDIAVEIPVDIKTFSDPRKIKKCGKNALEIKNIRIPEIKEPCITVEYAECNDVAIHLDFPIYALYNEEYYLARGKEHSSNFFWEKCDPHGLNDYLDKLFAGDKGNQLRRIIRYLKKWKLENYVNSCGKDQKPAGIALTLLAGEFHQYKQSCGKDEDLKALIIVVEGIKSSFKINANGTRYIEKSLPVLPYTDGFYKMNEKSQEVFYEKIKIFLDALKNAELIVEEYEAARCLQKIFGSDFELPKKPESRVGVPMKENSYA